MQYINTNITIEYYGILGNGKLNKVQDFDTKAKTIQRQYLFFSQNYTKLLILCSVTTEANTVIGEFSDSIKDGHTHILGVSLQESSGI